MKNSMETVNQQTLSNNLDEILDRISENRITAMVVKDDQPRAILLPYEIYQQWISAREQRLKQVANNLQLWGGKHSKELIGLDSAELIREIRNNQ